MQPLDWAVLAAYAALILAIGWYASRGSSSAESHLRAGRDLPAWAVVFSILSTEVSAATYIGVPEAAFRGNWTYLQFAIGALLGKWVLSSWMIRLYWRLGLPTVYGWLGSRVGPRTQRATAWAFLGGRLIASGVRLYIAALAFAVASGFSLEASIVAMALLSTAYTFFGGLKAVVWTDVAQGSIFAIGAATALFFGLDAAGLTFGELLGRASAAGKLEVISFSGDWLRTTSNLPAALVGGFFLALATHGTDQENVQHMLNTRSERSSARSILTSGLFTFPIVALFLSVGTMLWAYHAEVAHPAYSIEGDEARRIFPNFIMHALPAGLRGLVFAGLFAAAISSLGATLNAVTTAWVTDIRPEPPGARDASPGARDVIRGGLRRARLLISVFGVLLALVALGFSVYSRDSKSDLVQIALSAMTILYGGILGTFLSALVYRRRGSDGSVLAGLCAGVAVGAFLFFHRPLFGLEAEWIAWPWSLPLSAGTALLVAALGRRAEARVVELAA